MAASHTSVRTAAHALVEALEAHGVEVAFGIPGQHALALWDALESSSIRTVVVRHEQAASFAAVGYARTSDRVGVCITSTGPGAFNTFAGMGEADASSLRVLHITTQVPSDAGERGWMHESVGQSIAFTAVTRHHVRPGTPRALAASVDEALTAIASRPGPAMIEVMTDLLKQPADGAVGRVTPACAAGARPGRRRPRALAARRRPRAAGVRRRRLAAGRRPGGRAGRGTGRARRHQLQRQGRDAARASAARGLVRGGAVDSPPDRGLGRLHRPGHAVRGGVHLPLGRRLPCGDGAGRPRPLADRPQLPGGRGRGRRRRAVLRCAAGALAAGGRARRRRRGARGALGPAGGGCGARLRGGARADPPDRERAARTTPSPCRT